MRTKTVQLLLVPSSEKPSFGALTTIGYIVDILIDAPLPYKIGEKMYSAADFDVVEPHIVSPMDEVKRDDLAYRMDRHIVERIQYEPDARLYRKVIALPNQFVVYQKGALTDFKKIPFSAIELFLKEGGKCKLEVELEYSADLAPVARKFKPRLINHQVIVHMRLNEKEQSFLTAP